MLKINKRIRIGTIYEYIDTMYILTNAIYILAVLATTFNTNIEPFSSIQKDIIFGSRYPYISLVSPLFQGDIIALDIEFIFILEIEAKLTVYNEVSTSLPISFDPTDYLQSYIAFLAISFGDVVYTIVTNVIQAKEAEERVAVTI